MSLLHVLSYNFAHDFPWHGIEDFDRDFIDNGHLSILKLGYFTYIRFGYLSLCCKDQYIVESYIAPIGLAGVLDFTRISLVIWRKKFI